MQTIWDYVLTNKAPILICIGVIAYVTLFLATTIRAERRAENNNKSD